MARRKFRRSFAGKRNGRNYFWFRFTPFALTLQSAAQATHSDLIISESDWQDPSAELNQTQRGGARLERLIVDFGLALDADAAFYASSGSGQIALVPEFMIWKQSDQFVSTVSSSASFDETRANQRVIMDMIPQTRDSFPRNNANNSVDVEVRGHFETKSKVRLADGALGVAWRGLFNTGDANLNGYSDWVRPTILMSTP